MDRAGQRRDTEIIRAADVERERVRETERQRKRQGLGRERKEWR